MKAGGGVILGFVVSSPRLSLMTLSKVSLLSSYVSEFSSYMLRGKIHCRVTIVALEVITVCDISLPSFFMGLRACPRHYLVDGKEFGVL